jgi:ABC-type multidrug transport system fused ATPase/permease subunit
MKTSQSDNSPFIIGLIAHPDLEAAQFALLVDAVVRFLLDIKRLLPDTDVRVMLDAGGDLSPAIMRAILTLEICVDALIFAPTPAQATDHEAEPLKEFSHPQVHWIKVAPVSSHVEHSAVSSILGDILVRRSSLLLALWDGKSSSIRNDTADQVFRFLGVRGEQSETLNSIEVTTAVHDLDETAQLVFWVPAQRGNSVSASARQQPCHLLSAGDNVVDVQQSMPSSLTRRLVDLNEYNRDFARFTADSRLVRSASLMRDTFVAMAANDAAALENIDRQFVKADSLAGYMQRRSEGLFNLFGLMAFATGLAYLIYDKFTEDKMLLMFCLIILFVSLLVYYFFKTKHWFSKYLSYRALAETLRVRFYLTLAGIDRRIQTRELVALTGICRFEGFGWISFALDSIESAQLAMDYSNETYALRARLVEQAWIEDQYQYFARKVAAMERHRAWARRLKGGAFVAVLVVLAVLWMFGDVLHHFDARTGVPVKNVLTFFSGALAVVLGVWELRQNKMALQELLWQYRNQLHQFERARRQLKRTSSRSRRDDIVEELGKNSLMEIYLWAIHRYHREHAPPTGL